MNIVDKLALGTVQFGLNYGVTNLLGQTDRKEVEKILALATKFGLNLLDTATLYGDSEIVIGSSKLKSQFNIVTKTPHFINKVITESNATELENSFLLSLKRLKVKPYGLLIHNADDMLKTGGFKLYEKLNTLKKKGLVKKIGFSVYNPEQCNRIIEKFDMDLVQIPMNIYDQRFLRSGILTLLKEKNIEIHVRSTFLQGLVLLKTLPKKFEGFQGYHNRFLRLCRKYDQSQLIVALSFIASTSQVDKLIIGVNNVKQLREILVSDYVDICLSEFEDLSISDSSFINPTLW